MTSTLQLYRHILKAAKYFPSIKRDKIIKEIQHEFRANKGVSDPEQRKHCIAVAERGLSDLQAYSGARTAGSNFDIYLKGATT